MDYIIIFYRALGEKNYRNHEKFPSLLVLSAIEHYYDGLNIYLYS